MRRWLEGLETFAIDVILERRYGRRADILRWFLYGLSRIYLSIVQSRLSLYRSRVMRPRTVGCLVISVGNLSVGGTGKTPVVEMLARALHAGGRKVAILSRGYKSVPRPLLLRLWDKLAKKKAVFVPRVVSDGQTLLLDSRTAGDEPFMLANNLRGVVVLVDRDRVKSGQYAVEHFGTDTLLLDDGYQYVRMKRGIEVALVDRQAPFGNEYLLPRGTLREPPENLRRATHIFITKCTGADNADLIDRIRSYNRTADIIECSHRPTHVTNVFTGENEPLDFLKGMTVGSICGIAMPTSFEDALRKLGAKIEIAKSFTDHHRYTKREIEQFIRRCARRDIQAILTTEKDAVRIPRIIDPEVPMYYLRVEIEILAGQANWERFVNRLTTQQPVMAPQRFFA
ncbi:tetraacyldisaccharide 4'-kinase [Terrimicrobium sacchariphilum]|jgi:tetraacyldisaccharide 4'-kinase|uniref:Tetraacyldisaccharide 4'-kinase n=1 Tax=Terrimicrobium sacchariphilum TaxID=690879 RepID=A0A146G8E9_TERSA|nr:tetraacyldisaccharide 4'-kinase [Terrimicrobium sacchariphilum]GAT33174.1 tetraacyldisaccharide 4'-kinase [Terrimicrobium sacchariphilum]